MVFDDENKFPSLMIFFWFPLLKLSPCLRIIEVQSSLHQKSNLTIWTMFGYCVMFDVFIGCFLLLKFQYASKLGFCFKFPYSWSILLNHTCRLQTTPIPVDAGTLWTSTMCQYFILPQLLFVHSCVMALRYA